jgi:hypothetical protein
MNVEYLLAVSFSLADRAARKQGWQQSGRASWQKSDGTIVCFISYRGTARLYQ